MKKRTTIILDEALWWRVKERAARERRNAQDIIADAIKGYLRKPEKGRGKRR